MSKRSIRKLRHLPVERAVERSTRFQLFLAHRTQVVTDREEAKGVGAFRRALPGGRDERKAAHKAAGSVP